MSKRTFLATHRRSDRSSSPFAPPFALLCLVLALAGSTTWAVEEEVRAIRHPRILLESEPRPAEDLDIPGSSYPLTPLDRAAIHGSRHGFLSTSSGTLSFRAFEIHLPGRMPIEFAPVYSSGISESLPPALPGQGGGEPRRVKDLGMNWILDYASYLSITPSGVSMWTPEGDSILWVDQGNNTFRRSPDVASHHLLLEKIPTPAPARYVETRSDGTKWTYRFQTGGYFLTEIADRSGNTLTLASGRPESSSKNSSGDRVRRA